MCGRYNFTDSAILQALFEALGVDIGPVPVRHNICPTDYAPVITAGGGEMVSSLMRWWLVPSWSKGPNRGKGPSNSYPMFNARAETLDQKPSFKQPFKTQRCLVPVSSFIERNRDTKEYFECLPVEFGFLLAGLWDHWTDGQSTIYSFTIITTQAPECFQGIHHRMPVALTIDEARAWVGSGIGGPGVDAPEVNAPDIDGKTLKRFFRPQLKQPYEVRPLGNKLKGPSVKEPLEPLGSSFLLH